MSLRKQAKILGISPTYLSLLLNGKRPWRGNLKERYEELVNTFVNTQEANSLLTKASEDDFVPELVVPREGLEPTLPCGKRILSPPRLPFRHLGNFVEQYDSKDHFYSA